MGIRCHGISYSCHDFDWVVMIRDGVIIHGLAPSKLIVVMSKGLNWCRLCQECPYFRRKRGN